MKNRNVSDIVAQSMDTILNSQEHKSLFYKKASDPFERSMGSGPRYDRLEKEDRPFDPDAEVDESEMEEFYRNNPDLDNMSPEEAEWRAKQELERKARISQEYEEDSGSFDFNDANDKKHRRAPVSSHLDDLEDMPATSEFDEVMSEEPSFSAGDDDSFKKMLDEKGFHSSAYNIAIDSLLTASAALDRLGLDRGSSLSLKLASLVVEAKKKPSAAQAANFKKMLDAKKLKGKSKMKDDKSSKSSKKSSDKSGKSSTKK